jgi:hypothetical protein
LDDTYDKLESEYLREQNPCRCARVSEIEQETVSENMFIVTCQYDYCQECYEETGICATQLAADLIDVVNGPISGSYCLEFTIPDGRDIVGSVESGTVTCLNYGVSGEELFCAVEISGNLCNSCSFVICNGFRVPTFDCSNIQALALQTNGCDTVNEDFPIDSPYSAFRQDIYQFQSCSVQMSQVTSDPNTAVATSPPTTSEVSENGPPADEPSTTEAPTPIPQTEAPNQPPEVSANGPPTEPSTTEAPVPIPQTETPTRPPPESPSNAQTHLTCAVFFILVVSFILVYPLKC